MRKEITVYAYDNNGGSRILGDPLLSYGTEDFCEMRVLLPEGWDAWRNSCGLVLQSPDGIPYSPFECLRYKNGVPYILGKRIKVLSEKRGCLPATL